MVMLIFAFHSFLLDLTLNMFHIHTPLWSNQLMMIKCNIYCNSSTQNMMMIFWILTSRCFGICWWLTLLKNVMQSLLFFFINMEERMFLSQIACHGFLCLSQPRPLWNCILETRDIPKELVLFYVAFLNVTLYVQWYQFIIFHVTLPTPSHQLPSNFMLYFKRLRLNFLNIVNFLTLEVILGDHPTRIKNSWLSSIINFQSQGDFLEDLTWVLLLKFILVR